MNKRNSRVVIFGILILIPLYVVYAATLAGYLRYLPIVAKPEKVTSTSTSTATPTSTDTLIVVPPTNTSTPTQTQTPQALVEITHIEYDPEGDDLAGEFVQIKNQGAGQAVMTSWTLRDEANHVYTFPTFTLQPGAIVLVWTKSGIDDSGNLYWGSGSAIWNNDGDCAYLKNSGGYTIDTFCYNK